MLFGRRMVEYMIPGKKSPGYLSKYRFEMVKLPVVMLMIKSITKHQYMKIGDLLMVLKNMLLLMSLALLLEAIRLMMFITEPMLMQNGLKRILN